MVSQIDFMDLQVDFYGISGTSKASKVDCCGISSGLLRHLMASMALEFTSMAS
uniref:Uncharacterized protein n=1 Tax=Ditylenchus dipsaci TaxID=166011 RepID=A0A915E1F7_9BILA